MTSQTGFLLSYLKYGERDAVLQCFTQEKGYQTFFVKGIYGGKSRKKAYLLPLKLLLFTFSSKPLKTEMIPVLDLEPVQKGLPDADVKANAMVFFVAEFLRRVLRNEPENSLVFRETEAFLTELERQNYRAHLIFILQHLKNSGVMPLPVEKSYLNPEKGVFEEEISHQLFDRDISALWKEIITAEKPYTVPVPAKYRTPLLESLMVYCQFHIPDFKTPDSLAIVRQIFE